MVVKPTSVEFLGGSMSADSHHSVFWRRSCIDPKRSTLVSLELNLNQIDSTVGSCAPHFPKRKDAYRFSVDRAAGYLPRPDGKSLLDEDGQQVRPNTLFQQVSTSSCFSFSCPSSSERVLEAHAHSLW
jgi:hypothetical protein